MSEAKTVNYTDEQTKRLVAVYTEQGKQGLEALAAEFGKSVRSMVAKLSREGVYKTEAKAKGTEKAMTKAELATAAEKALGLEAGTFESFEKASKPALEALVKALA